MTTSMVRNAWAMTGTRVWSERAAKAKSPAWAQWVLGTQEANGPGDFVDEQPELGEANAIVKRNPQALLNPGHHKSGLCTWPACSTAALLSF